MKGASSKNGKEPQKGGEEEGGEEEDGEDGVEEEEVGEEYLGSTKLPQRPIEEFPSSSSTSSSSGDSSGATTTTTVKRGLPPINKVWLAGSMKTCVRKRLFSNILNQSRYFFYFKF